MRLPRGAARATVAVIQDADGMGWTTRTPRGASAGLLPPRLRKNKASKVTELDTFRGKSIIIIIIVT